ncbi:MAG: hypothetical protein IJW17_08420 [Lentisphaeria bacterium]|nr:hypothetical protein [Lentisphaeria bacterium]
MKKISYGLLLLISFFCRGENIVFQENFDTAPNSKKWQLKFKSYPDKTYTASRILKKELSLQDFYWGGDIATAKSPEFAPCETWQIEFDLCFQSVPSGKKKDYQYKIQLLTANGEIAVEFPILCDGKTPGGKLLGKIPLEEKKYYRITATRKYQDQRFDIIAEDKQSGKKSSLQDISFTRDIPVVRLCFQAVTGWDAKGIMAIDNIVIKTFGKPVKRIFKAVTFMKNDFLSLAVSADGKTEICDKNGQQLFILGVPELPGQIQASFFKPVKLQNDNPTSPVVYYETIATSTHLAGSQNQVLGVEAYDSNGKKLYLMQWTLFKKGARLRILPQLILNENRHKNIAGIPFFPAVGYREVNRFAPMRLFQHPTGGEPTDEVRGQIVDFQSFAIGIAGNMPDAWNFYKKDNIRFEIKNTQMAFGKDFPCGTVAFSLRSNPQARRREILARAGDERLVMDFSHPHPFFISDHPGTWQGDIHIGNYFRKKQRCSVNYTARDYNGTIIASGKFSEVLAEDQETVFPLKLNLDKPGPVYIELFGHHESGGDYIRICGGYLPRYDFKAGKESRIGVSAFRGTVGAHTEKRTPEEFFRFMKHMGISLTRMAYGVEDTAHKHGIRTWMHLNIANDAHTRDYFDRKRTTWLNIPENREKYLKAQMQRAANSGAEVYEFSNEWNLHGGDNRAHRAELYAKDWLPLIKKLRDKYFPQLKIGGLVIANADMSYMQKVYENGGWQLFDYLVFHASGVPRSAENDDNYWSYFRTLKNIRKALNNYGEKPL